MQTYKNKRISKIVKCIIEDLVSTKQNRKINFSLEATMRQIQNYHSLYLSGNSEFLRNFIPSVILPRAGSFTVIPALTLPQPENFTVFP